MRKFLMVFAVAALPSLARALDPRPWDPRFASLRPGAVLLAQSAPLPAAAPVLDQPSVQAPTSGAYFQHAVLTPSNVQGQVFAGAMRTNAGWVQETALPVFYHNASGSDPWWRPSLAPLVLGYSSGGGLTFGNLGPIVDFGPQLVYGTEWLVGLFSASGQSHLSSFFNCSAASNACGTISAGILANGTFEQDGRFVRTWHEFGAHPLGEFLGPSVFFQ